ncbi:MAG TPA: RidA family protein [Candidatus Angelobacter sp.]|nr:RidA family protein [Candidatus Angelobacter sp.]
MNINLASKIVLAALIMVFMPKLSVAQANTAKETAPAQTQFLNPSGLSKPTGYTHVVVAQPGKLIYVSGQVALNAAGDVVGKGDLRAQVTQVMENLKTALAAAGATPENIIKVNYYVVNLKPDQLPVIREVRGKYFSAEHPPASTLIGVTALAREEFLIEIEAVAAIK